VTDVSSGPEAGGNLQKLAKDGVLGLFGAAISAVLNVVLVMVVIRSAGKEGAGVVFAVTSLFLIASTVARLGSPTGLVYFLVRARTAGRVEALRHIVRTGLGPVVVASLVVAGLMIVGAPTLARWIVPKDPDVALVPLRVLALLLPAAAVSDTLLMGSRGFDVMRPLILVERIGRSVGQVLLTGVAILLGAKGATGLTSAWALPYVVTAAIAIAWTVKLVRRAEHRADVKPSLAPGGGAEYWRFTAPRALQSIVQIALQRLDVVLVAALRGPGDAAVYAAVTRFLVFGQLGAQAITSAVQPRLGAQLSVGDLVGAGRVYQVSTCWLVLLTWPVYLSLAVFSKQIPDLFGRGYGAGTAVLVVLAGAMLIATGSGLVDVVLAMSGRTTWTLANSIMALTVDVTLNLILIPRIGILGAAVAWAGAIVANNLVPLAQLGLAMHLHPFGRGTLLAMGTAATWLAAVPVAAGLLASWTAPVLLAGMALGTVGYVLTLWRWRSVFELDALRGAGRRAPLVAAEI